jgi:hypothetical protein
MGESFVRNHQFATRLWLKLKSSLVVLSNLNRNIAKIVLPVPAPPSIIIFLNKIRILYK